MTLQSENFVLPQSTQEALGFDALWRALENNCGCIYGRENLNESPFLGSVEAIEARMAEVWAAKVFLEKQNFTLISNLNEIRFFLEAALKDEVLSSADLKEISQSLVIMSRLKYALQAGAGAQLLGVVATMRNSTTLPWRFSGVLMNMGIWSPTLRLWPRPKHKSSSYKSACVTSWKSSSKLWMSRGFRTYFTLRNERYVLPVRWCHG